MNVKRVSGRENLDQVMWLINQMAEKPSKRGEKTHWIHIAIHRIYEAFVGKTVLAGRGI
jgi:hypothetical protein